MRRSARTGCCFRRYSLVLLSLSILAGLGAANIFRLRPGYATPIAAAATLFCVLEFWSAPVSVRSDHSRPTEAHQWLSSQAPGAVIVELPMPQGEALWLYETTYQIRSTHHWQRLVNGYSGFAPEEYRRTLADLRAFPDRRSSQRLQELGVRFVVINRAYYTEEVFNGIMAQLMAEPSFRAPRPFGPDHDQILIVEMQPPP